MILLVATNSFAIQNARLMRMPDINDDLVVFVYAGDLWRVSAGGGDAVRLTSHEGLEIFPKISPDKKWVAFSGEYSGSRQIYIMPVNGGIPRQLTFYNDAGVMPPRGGFDHIPLDWTADSKKILIRANRTPYGIRMGKYFLVDIEGGLETSLQIPEAGFGTFSPDQKSVVYTPISREFRTWKRSKGGRAADVWIYDLEKDTSRRLTDFNGTDHIPVWFKNKIFFVSDRDLTLDFYSYDLGTEEIAQVTTFDDYDVLWPSGHNGRLVFEKGGYLHTLDLDTNATAQVKVNINFDNPNRLPSFKNVSRNISRFGVDLSPDGKRAIFDGRGDLFSVPAEKGVTLNLTQTQGVREKYPTFSPDGKWLAYISDESGDYEFFMRDPLGKKPPVQLTTNDKVWKYPADWSPDSKWLLFPDADRKLRLLNVETKKLTTMDKGVLNDIGSYEWSADSKWIVYSKTETNWLDSIYVYSLDKKESYRLTDGKYNDYAPSFSKDGKHIFFLSNRDFNMNFQQGFSSMEFDFVYNQTTRIYAMALVKDAPDLFKEENDLEETKPAASPEKDKAGDADKAKDKAQDKDKEEKKPEDKPAVTIDLDGIGQRITVFPLATANYGGVTDIGGKILYFKDGELRLYDLKAKKDDLVIEGIGRGVLSADNTKLLYNAGGQWGIIPVQPNQKAGTGSLDLGGMDMKIDPVKEWEQIYNEGWRIFRDWFYVYNMHGVDWEKMRAKYAELLPYVSHRADLDYIFGELVGELNVGHTYVNWGDFERVPRLNTGLLGAEFEADLAAKRYKIHTIFEGENWNENTRSPLTEPGIDVKAGDYIIALNGHDLTTEKNLYNVLENTAGKLIPITVNDKPKAEGAKTYWVKPVRSEQDLRYLDWVNSRRRMVDELSGGRIAYIHVPNTGVEGNRELFKGVYAYNDKDAFIIDDRYNGGGWTPGKMVEKLSQRAISYWHRRGLELRQEPTFALDGPMVMLINHYSSSGGDNFPYWFKKRELGKLIGTRTWGGLVGYSWSPSLVDGPSFAVPMSGIVGTDGEHIVEGVGVYPDEGFEVYDRPEDVARGKDPSLEVAVKYLLEELKKNPPKKVKDPADPIRSKWFEKEIKKSTIKK